MCGNSPTKSAEQPHGSCVAIVPCRGAFHIVDQVEVAAHDTLRRNRLGCRNHMTADVVGVTHDNENAFIPNRGRCDRPLYCVGRRRGNIRRVQRHRRRNDANGLYAIRVQPRHQNRLCRPECATWLERGSKGWMESRLKAAWIAPITALRTNGRLRSASIRRAASFSIHNPAKRRN